MRRRPTIRLLITAGPTREYLDPVRYLSNDSSGRMGFALAAAARRRGHRVTLVHGPVVFRPPVGVRAVPVVSAAQMLAAGTKLWPKHDVLIMAAAVADYAPVRAAAHKRRKSARELRLRLKLTPDILTRLAASRRQDQIVVGFALEDRNPRHNARRKLEAKQLDAIVLNRPAAIGATRCAVDVLVRGEPWQAFREAIKEQQAVRILKLVERLWSARLTADPS